MSGPMASIGQGSKPRAARRPACACGALIAFLVGRGRPWDTVRTTAAILAAANACNLLAWVVLDLLKSGAIRF